MIVALLFAMQGASPETDAVMDRSRREAASQRALSADEASAVRAKEEAQQERLLPLSREVAAKLQSCLGAATQDPAAGVKFASEWAVAGGDYIASQCRGFAHAKAEQWDQAIAAFDSAAMQAQKAGGSSDAARLWGQAGNAALAGGQAEAAIGYFDAALGHGLPNGLAKGEIYLDRARAQVSLNKLDTARADMNQAIALAPADPLVWLLSAALARRTNDLTRAWADIGEAVKRSPDDASVALEQGNIAMLTGREADADAAWRRAIALAPQSEQAKAAREALAQIAPAAGK